jgi:hypothetical protein
MRHLTGTRAVMIVTLLHSVLAPESPPAPYWPQDSNLLATAQDHMNHLKRHHRDQTLEEKINVIKSSFFTWDELGQPRHPGPT